MRRSSIRAIGVGLAVVAIYAGGAALSGHLSLFARRPILDGGPPQPYRYVSPPPELAATNLKPTPGEFDLTFNGPGSIPQAFQTPDFQVVLLLPAKTVAASPGQDTVHIVVTPIDPSTLTPPGAGLEFDGNAYKVEMTFDPSGKPVELAKPMEVVLAYPVTAATHSQLRGVTSSDGTGWTVSKGTVATGTQQLQIKMTSPGYVAVAAPPAAVSPPGTGTSGTIAVPLAVIGAVILVAIAVVVWRFRRGAARTS